MVSIAITVLMCMPICSFVFLTRKRVYKKSALTEEGTEVNLEATAVPKYGGVAAGQPIEEQKQNAEATPAKSALMDKGETNEYGINS